jgi:hypothetical protein
MNVTNVISLSILGKYILIFEALCRWVSLSAGVLHVVLHSWRIWTRQCACCSQKKKMSLSCSSRDLQRLQHFPHVFHLSFNSLAEKAYIHYFKLDKMVCLIQIIED